MSLNLPGPGQIVLNLRKSDPKVARSFLVPLLDPLDRHVVACKNTAQTVFNITSNKVQKLT
jgi:hypothetical protein